jgi:hypothetical protein
MYSKALQAQGLVKEADAKTIRERVSKHLDAEFVKSQSWA